MGAKKFVVYCALNFQIIWDGMGGTKKFFKGWVGRDETFWYGTGRDPDTGLGEILNGQGGTKEVLFLQNCSSYDAHMWHLNDHSLR